MFNKIRVILILLVFGAAMFIAGLLAPESIRTTVISWLPAETDSPAGSAETTNVSP